MLDKYKNKYYEYLVAKSGYFDKEYYYEKYKDVKEAKVNPVAHYINYGWKEGRNPSKKFDTIFYLSKYEDVRNSNINPLIHYLKHGKKEKRIPKPNLENILKEYINTKKILVFDHSLGGGANQYFKDVILSLEKDNVVVRVQYWLFNKTYSISLFKNEKCISEIKNIYDDEIAVILKTKFIYEKIIINNLAGYPNISFILNLIVDIKKEKKTKKVIYKGHDYYPICPSFTLMNYNKEFCGVETNEIICKQCYDYIELKIDDIKDNFSITRWRKKWASFFSDVVDEIEIYSNSSKNIFLKIFPDIKNKIIYNPHKITKFPNGKYTIAIIGHLLEIKGANVIRDCLKYLENNDINDYKFILFGDNPTQIKSNYFEHYGKYERNDLPNLLKKYDINAIFISSIIPETFSYTTAEAISLGYPVFCFDLGGQSDQVKNYEKGIILKSTDPRYILDIIAKTLITKNEVAKDNETNLNLVKINKIDTDIETEEDKQNKAYLKYLFNNQIDKSKYVCESNDDVPIESDVKPVALYLPQYHDFPENVKWFGRGFSEWTNTSKTVPQYIGHWQPHIPTDVGYYNLNNIEVMRRQIELAKKYGIYGFGFYYYWFSGDKLMEKPIEMFLNDKTMEIPFFLFWANEDWSMLWDNGEYKEVLHKSEILDGDDIKFMNDILPYMKDDRYIKINDKPLLCIYQLETVPYEKYIKFVNSINRIAKKNGFDGLYLISPLKENYDFDCLEKIQEKYMLSSLFEFYPQGLQTRMPQKKENFINKKNKSICFDVHKFIEEEQYIFETKAKLMKGLFPNWDNSPRRVLQGATIFESNPEDYKKWFKEIIKWERENIPKNERIIFINAWNEWAEGAHIEPDTKYGYAYLQKTKEAILEMKIDTE